MDKSQLRQSLQQKLHGIEAEERVARSKKACRNLIETPEFQQASVVMLYLAIPYEVDTSDAILCAWQMGKVVAVPKVSWEQRHMIPVQIHTLETEPAWEGARLHNPVVGQPIALEEIDLVVTPGLGYDEKGRAIFEGYSPDGLSVFGLIGIKPSEPTLETTGKMWWLIITIVIAGAFTAFWFFILRKRRKQKPEESNN